MTTEKPQQQPQASELPPPTGPATPTISEPPKALDTTQEPGLVSFKRSRDWLSQDIETR